MTKLIVIIACIAGIAGSTLGQTKEAYESGPQAQNAEKGLLDPSRFSIHHMLSFEAGSAFGSSLKSQSLYSTMIAYKLAEPVTIRLNFGLPIHSTFLPSSSLSMNNIQSAEYFRNMPIDASIVWKPKDNLTLQLNVTRHTAVDYYNSFSGMNYWGYRPYAEIP